MIIFNPEYMLKNSALRPIIKVIGVGGSGNNTLATLLQNNISGIQYIALNTDSQALAKLDIPYKLQIGSKQLRGFGTGANPEIGRQAAEEDAQKITEFIKDADIVFLVAGLGGGTGSGALPVIARILQERDILSIALVTKPFIFEGSRRMQVAEATLVKLEEYVDSLIVIPNQKLFESDNEAQTSLLDAFEKINTVMSNCIKTVSDTIYNPGHINIDFADIKATMTRMGKAVMGIGRATGHNRAEEAVHLAITSKLLEHTSLKGAKSILINISGGKSITLNEVGTIAAYIHEQAHHDARIIMGSGIDESLGDELIVTLIATGFEEHMKNRTAKQHAQMNAQSHPSYSSHSTQNQHVASIYPDLAQESHFNPYSAQAQNQQSAQNNLEIPALLKKLMAEQNK